MPNPTQELVAIKVRVGLKDGRQHAWPDFNRLDPVVRGNMDWSYWVSQFESMHYDRVAGHADDTPESPFGYWYCMILVNPEFADAAIDRFPDDVEQLDEAEAEKFYDERAHINDPSELYDQAVLDGIKAKKDLGLTLTADDLKALDPENSTAGIRRNRRKTWNGYRQSLGMRPLRSAKKKR